MDRQKELENLLNKIKNVVNEPNDVDLVLSFLEKLIFSKHNDLKESRKFISSHIERSVNTFNRIITIRWKQSMEEYEKNK